MSRIYCIECNKTLRNYSAGKPRVHRSCWLKLRDTSDRHYDFLFCNDKKNLKKTEYIKPINGTVENTQKLPPINEDNEDDYTFVLDIKGNLLKLPKTFVVETLMETLDVSFQLNDEINELIDNFHLSPISSPSSSSPPPSASPVLH